MSTFRGYGCCCRKLHHNPKGHLFYWSRDFVKTLSTRVFTKKFNAVSPVLMNVYMPGLVRTKILANEPQPMRLMVKIMNRVIGIPVEKSAVNVFIALNDIIQNKRRDAVYQWKAVKPSSALDMNADDPQRLWDVTNQLLKPYL